MDLELVGEQVGDADLMEPVLKLVLRHVGRQRHLVDPQVESIDTVWEEPPVLKDLRLDDRPGLLEVAHQLIGQLFVGEPDRGDGRLLGTGGTEQRVHVLGVDRAVRVRFEVGLDVGRRWFVARQGVQEVDHPSSIRMP